MRNWLLLIGLGIGAGVLLARKASSTLSDATKPAGDWLSDVGAWANGHKPVELTALVLKPHYFRLDYTLTNEAEYTLWKVPEYQSVLKKLFGEKGAPLKIQYYSLIGKAITEASL